MPTNGGTRGSDGRPREAGRTAALITLVGDP
jgi:hypothetical protein